MYRLLCGLIHPSFGVFQMRSLISFLCLGLFAVASFGQAPDPGKFAPIKDRFDKFVADKEIAGSVELIGRKNGIEYVSASGMANIEKKIPMKPETVFRIASMTKPITAIAIMILQDEGKLSVDDPVEKYLPDFKGQMMVASKDKDTVTLKKPARAILLRDLLTHTSGLPNYPAGMADVYTKRNRTLNETTIAVSQLPLMFEPGSKWSYCNPGIDTLGRIIEVTSGMSYEAFLKTRIFDPLGMTTTSPYPSKELLDRTAITYTRTKEGELQAVANTLLDLPGEPKHPVPAGGLYSTAEDLSKVYRMMLNQGELGGKRILSEKAVAQMTSTQTGDIVTGFTPGASFGFGWCVLKKPQGVTEGASPGTYGHGGAFGTQAWIDPSRDFFYIMLIQRSNTPGGDGSEMRKEMQNLVIAAQKK
jgi:CubicO group peptidase (beta-lactamase class C family)